MVDFHLNQSISLLPSETFLFFFKLCHLKFRSYKTVITDFLLCFIHFINSPINYHDWPWQNFSLQCQYNVKQSSKEKISTRGLLVDPIPNSQNKHYENCMEDTEENYQWDLGVIIRIVFFAQVMCLRNENNWLEKCWQNVYYYQKILLK